MAKDKKQKSTSSKDSESKSPISGKVFKTDKVKSKTGEAPKKDKAKAVDKAAKAEAPVVNQRDAGPNKSKSAKLPVPAKVVVPAPKPKATKPKAIEKPVERVEPVVVPAPVEVAAPVVIPVPKPEIKKIEKPVLETVKTAEPTPEIAPKSAAASSEKIQKVKKVSSSKTSSSEVNVLHTAPHQQSMESSSFVTGKRVLIVTSECTPLATTGGLGDAVAGLSKALQRHGHDVRIVMPLYRSIDRNRFGLTFKSACCVHFGNKEEIWVGVYEAKLGKVPIWFIDYERYFGRPGLYDEPSGPDNGYRFGVLSKAALQLCKDYQFYPHIAHVHDWMSSPVSVFLKTWDRVLSPLSHTASVLTIHNLGYQGKSPRSILPFYGLGNEYFHADAFEDHGSVNLLKAGIQFSDAVTTVSPTYAREILSPIGGQGLGMYLERRRGDLFGILNGVDTDVWDPSTDKYLPAHFSRKNLAGKAECKAALQREFGLEVNPKLPIFGIVSRFAPQKGFDLVRGALPQALRDMAIQVVALGSGDRLTEGFMRWMSTAFPGRANAHIGFSPHVAHLIEAGSDFFIMPSLYEPCGLNQMYSSLYGTLPIVRATGGLDDTVENYDESAGKGTGFKFWDINDRALYFTLGWANSTWWDRPHHYSAMQLQGMAKDFTWDHAAKEYERVYECALRKKLAAG